MKRITFKILSILLAAVLLVAALPVTAFAGSSISCRQDPINGDHSYGLNIWYAYEYISNEYHLIIEYNSQVCSICNKVINAAPVDYWYVEHLIDDSVDPECDMQGLCVYCNEMIYW